MPYADLEKKRANERERRRDRYANDPEYRQRVRATQKRWKARNPGMSDADKRWEQANHERKMELQRARRSANPAQYLWSGAYARAKKKGVPFSITVDDIVVPDTCPILGVPFELGRTYTPFSPTLDRIRPELGYVPGNIQVISRRANAMKSDASPEELARFAQWVLSATGAEVIE